jgi:hypothetical protein
MTPRNRHHRPEVRGDWQPSQDPQQPTCMTTADELRAQLAWIDKRIRRSQQHAATSNRARGAVREWTQKRLALLKRAADHGIGPGDPAGQE